MTRQPSGPRPRGEDGFDLGNPAAQFEAIGRVPHLLEMQSPEGHDCSFLSAQAGGRSRICRQNASVSFAARRGVNESARSRAALPSRRDDSRSESNSAKAVAIATGSPGGTTLPVSPTNSGGAPSSPATTGTAQAIASRTPRQPPSLPSRSQTATSSARYASSSPGPRRYPPKTARESSNSAASARSARSSSPRPTRTSQ